MSTTLQTIKDSAKDLNSNDPVKKARAEEIKRRYTQGLFNAELIKEGAKPVPIPKPKIDLKAAMAGVKQETGLQSTIPEAPKQGSVGPFDVGMSKESLMERGGDIVDTTKGFFDQLGTAGQDIVETATRDDRNLAEKATMIGGRAFGGGAGAIGELFTGLGKLALTQEAEDGLKQIAEKAVQKVADTELAQDAINWYSSLDPNTKDQVDAIGGFASALAEIIGVKGGMVVGKGLKEGAEAVAPVVKQGIKTATNTSVDVGKSAVGATQRMVTPSPEQASARITEAVKTIVQPTGKTTAERAQEVASAQKTLTRIAQTDIKDLQDYASLNKKIDETIQATAQAQDAHLAQFTETYKPERLSQGVTVNGVTKGWSPVREAIDGLENAYKLSGDIPGSLKIQQLRTKMETEGLTVAEINKLARDYNIEFQAKAFDKMGNPKPGYNAENYEAVRKGVKQVARDRMPDDVSKQLDAQMADDFETKRMIDRMNVLVQKRLDKLPKTSKLRKGIGFITGTAVNVADALSGRIVSNILSGIAKRAGVLQKQSLSPLELQAELNKQLKIIQKMEQIKDPKAYEKALEKYLTEDIGIGMSIKSTVQPDKIAASLSDEEIDMLRAYRQNPADKENFGEVQNLLERIGATDITNPEMENRFIDDVLNEFEQLNDNSLKQSFSQGATPQTTALLEEAKGKGRSEFVFSPKFEYHLSTSPNLKEGAFFADLPKAKDAGVRGGGGESIFTTKNPQAWHSQLAFEQNAETPNHVYLVEVKNPNTQRIQLEGSIPVDLQTVSNPDEVRILKKLGTVQDNKSLEAGLFESEKNKYLEDIWNQANKARTQD